MLSLSSDFLRMTLFYLHTLVSTLILMVFLCACVWVAQRLYVFLMISLWLIFLVISLVLSNSGLLVFILLSYYSYILILVVYLYLNGRKRKAWTGVDGDLETSSSLNCNHQNIMYQKIYFQFLKGRGQNSQASCRKTMSSRPACLRRKQCFQNHKQNILKKWIILIW